MLDQCASRWQDYDELYDDILRWMKSMENKVKEESSLCADLDSKQKQLDTLKVLLLSNFLLFNARLSTFKQQWVD
jgi:hypothetical protein